MIHFGIQSTISYRKCKLVLSLFCFCNLWILKAGDLNSFAFEKSYFINLIWNNFSSSVKQWNYNLELLIVFSTHGIKINVSSNPWINCGFIPSSKKCSIKFLIGFRFMMLFFFGDIYCWVSFSVNSRWCWVWQKLWWIGSNLLSCHFLLEIHPCLI